MQKTSSNLITSKVDYKQVNLQNNNKLWCKSTANPVPVLRIAASRGFSE